MGWLSGWTYRKSVTLSRVSGVVTNYQMKVLVGESSGASGADVHCEGHCKTDFADLRFTNSDGTTLLDYWIESISGTTPNQLATVWIEFDSIGTSATTFYMYYGNPGAGAASDGDSTFILFDDFNGSSLDTGKWNNNVDAADTLTITDSQAQLALADHSSSTKKIPALDSKSTTTLPCAVESRYKLDFLGPSTGGTAVRFAISIHKTANVYWESEAEKFVSSGCWRGDSTNDWENRFGVDSTFVKDYDNSVNEAWVRHSDIFLSGDSKAYRDGSLKLSNTGTSALSSGYLGLHYLISSSPSETQYIYIDFVAVRKYVSTEPTWGTWGSEEEEPAVTTLAPTTISSTLAPTTVTTTIAPTTLTPTTLTPTTLNPTTLAPTTLVSTTVSPTTLAPTTIAPTTLIPTTVNPTTIAPTTATPTTLPSTTLAPTTALSIEPLCIAELRSKMTTQINIFAPINKEVTLNASLCR